MSAENKNIVAAEAGDGEFVSVTDVIPYAVLEIRYYSSYNFVGERIRGYEAPVAYLTRKAALALKRAGDALLAQGYGVKIYDAYRPRTAVNHFKQWSEEAGATEMKPYFYPDLDKTSLFASGYIAERSGHSRGSTVDLTLVDLTDGREVDMGSGFDLFDERSHAEYTAGLTEEQIRHRRLLRETMLSHGFRPLAEEWWHFTLADEPYPDTYFDFPITLPLQRGTDQ